MAKNTFIIFSIFISFIDCHHKVIVNKEDKIKNNNIPELPIFLKSFQQSDTNITNIPILLHYKKTPCFGYCPVFEFTIYGNGVYCYNGLHFTPQEGKYYGLILEKDWNEIKNKFDILDFFNLKDTYPDNDSQDLPDLPKTIITINSQNRTKTITDTHSAPKNLKEFEKYLEDIISNLPKLKSK